LHNSEIHTLSTPRQGQKHVVSCVIARLAASSARLMAKEDESDRMIGDEAVEDGINISGVHTPYVRRIREVDYISVGLETFTVVVSCNPRI